MENLQGFAETLLHCISDLRAQQLSYMDVSQLWTFL